MDFGTFQVQVYDLLGLALPGFLVVCEVWATVRGWSRFWNDLSAVGPLAIAFVVIASYLAGALVQEIGESSLRWIVHPRFFARARDEFWDSAEANSVKKTIRQESGTAIEGVDAAFDYCIARVGADFPKRDHFVATADLSRSLLVILVLAVAPVSRLIFERNLGIRSSIAAVGLGLACLGLAGFLMWKRMLRFKEFSDVCVFRAYFAKAHTSSQKSGANNAT